MSISSRSSSHSGAGQHPEDTILNYTPLLRALDRHINGIRVSSVKRCFIFVVVRVFLCGR